MWTFSSTARPTIKVASSSSVAVTGGDPDDRAAPDDRYPVGDLLHFLELVADEDDRGPGGLELPHDAEQVLGLARGEDGGRLVQDEHARLAVQAP